MIVFIVTAIIVLVLSFLCGSSILYLLKLDKCPWFSFRTPIGFTVMMALLQLGNTYLTYTKHYDATLQWNVLAVVSAILIAAAFCWKGLASSFKVLFHRNEALKLLLGIALFSLLMWAFSHSIIEFRLDDINFYGTYIPDRIHKLSSYSSTYDYQAMYVFLSVLLEQTKWVIASFDLNISFLSLGFIEWVPAIITSWITAMSLVDFGSYLYQRMSRKPLFALVWIISAAVVFSDYWYFLYPHFGGTMRRVPLTLAFLIMHSMACEDRKGWKWLASLCFGGAIAINSSAFFIAMVTLYCWTLYSMILKRRGWIGELAVMLIFPASFAAAFRPSIAIVFVGFYVLVLLLIVIRKASAVEKFADHFGWIILVLVPIAIAVLVKLGHPTSAQMEELLGERTFFYPISNYDMVPELLQFPISGSEWATGWFNIVFWSMCLIAALLLIKRNSWLITLLFITVLTFFNPFVYNFIATYLTGIAYFRLTDIFFNYAMISELFIMLFTAYDSKLLKALSLVIFAALGTLKVFEFRFPNFIAPGSEEEADYNSEYRANQTELDVIHDFADEYLPAYKMCRVDDVDENYTSNIDDGVIKVASQIYGAQLFTDFKFYSQLEDRFLYVVIDTDEFQRLFARRLPGVTFPDVTYEHACTLMMDKNIDYVILDGQYNWQLQDGLWTCASDIYENGYYRVLFANRRYWGWNIKQGIAIDYSSEIGGSGS